MPITDPWAWAEERKTSGKVQRRRSQGLLAEIGLIHTDPVWAMLLDKLHSKLSPPGRAGRAGTQRQQVSRGTLQVLPIRKAESLSAMEGKFHSKIPQCR